MDNDKHVETVVLISIKEEYAIIDTNETGGIQYERKTQKYNKLSLRYITLHLKNDEIRQNYYFFADMK